MGIENSVNFTKENLDKLPLPSAGKRSTYYDAKTQGLQIRVSSSGVKTFCIYRRTKGGQPERITLGRYPDMTIEQVRIEAGTVNLSIEKRESPAQVRRAHKAEFTFADLFDRYLKEHSKPNKRTWLEDQQKYNQYLSSSLGTKKLSKIARKDAADIHSKITANGHSATANRVLALMSSIFGLAIEWGLVENNPCKGIRRNKEKSRERFLQADELPRFFQSVAEEPNITVRDILLIGLLTGARRENVLAMRWIDISFDRAEWLIPRTKNDDSHTITLSAESITILKNRKPTIASEYVFAGTGKQGYYKDPTKGWKRVLVRAKAIGFIQAIGDAAQWNDIQKTEFMKSAIASPATTIDDYTKLGKSLGIDPEQFDMSDLRIHDLRRSLGSWQAKTGASMAIIGKSLNHRSTQTTAIYARLDLDPVRESVDRATNAMMEAAGLKKSADVLPLLRKV